MKPKNPHTCSCDDVCYARATEYELRINTICSKALIIIIIKCFGVLSWETFQVNRCELVCMPFFVADVVRLQFGDRWRPRCDITSMVYIGFTGCQRKSKLKSSGERTLLLSSAFQVDNQIGRAYEFALTVHRCDRGFPISTGNDGNGDGGGGGGRVRYTICQHNQRGLHVLDCKRSIFVGSR